MLKKIQNLGRYTLQSHLYIELLLILASPFEDLRKSVRYFRIFTQGHNQLIFSGEQNDCNFLLYPITKRVFENFGGGQLLGCLVAGLLSLVEGIVAVPVVAQLFNTDKKHGVTGAATVLEMWLGCWRHGQ